MSQAEEKSNALATGQPKPARRATWRAKLLLLIASIGISAILAEVAVRVAKPGFPGFSLPQIKHRPASGIGFEMIPDQQGYTFASPVSVNSNGFRGPELRDRKSVDLRIVCLGDSITYGVGVDEAVTYPRQLEALVQTQVEGEVIEAINTGVQRYYTYQEIDFLRRSIDELQPDVVTLGLYYNDLGIRPAGDYVKRYENEREQAATAFRNRAPWLYLFAKNIAVVELLKKTYLSYKAGNRHVSFFEGEPTPKEELKWAALKDELSAFQQMSRTHGFQPFVVTIPGRVQVAQKFPESRFPRRALEFCEELGLPAVDVHQRFVNSLDGGVDPYLPWDNHMNAQGHRFVAEALANLIQGHREDPQELLGNP